MTTLNRHRLLSGTLVMLVGLSAWDNAAAAPRKPNIVLIVADDLGWTDLGFQGSKFYETPNLDRLAGGGMVFTDAYTPAANCAPTRACYMSGQYGPRHGIYTVGTSVRGNPRQRKLIPTPNRTTLPDENVTLAEALRTNGYATCHAGKWHLGGDARTQGFDVNIAGSHWGHPKRGYFSPYGMAHLDDGPKGEYLADRITTEALDFIEDHKDEPFFLHMAHYSVHTPIQPKPEKVPHYRQKKPTDRHNDPKYAAMIESLDENVGRLMDGLADAGLDEHTLVVFTTDNGGVYKITRQWPLRAGKGAYYEGGIRAPFVVRWPGKVAPGSRCATPVIGVDFYPTFLEAAAATPPEGKQLDGLSLIPLLTGQGSFPERPLFWHFPIYLQAGNSETRDPLFRTRPGSVIRLGDWKLHEYFEDGGLELYNLKDDIGEKHNLAAQMPEKVRELHAKLQAWREATGAPVPTEPNPAYRTR